MGRSNHCTEPDRGYVDCESRIGVALALLAGVTAYTVKRNRKKKDCKPEEEALDSAINAAKLAHDAFEPKQAALHDAIVNDAPKDVVDRARAERDEAQVAADTAMDTYRLARAAYQACKGGADTGDELDLSGLAAGMGQVTADFPDPETGDTPTDPPSPGVFGETDEPVDPDEKCREDNEKVLPDPSMPAKTFTVPIGNIVVRSGMASWTRLLGGTPGLKPAAFGDLSESDLDDALADFDDQSKKVRIHPQIPVAIYTVQCGYMHRCTNGEWVKTDEIGTYKVTRTVDTLRIGNPKDSPSKATAIKHVQEAQAKLKELQAEQEAYDDFECG